MGNGNPCPGELGSWAPTERNLQSRPRFFVSGQYEVGRAWNEEMIGPTNTLDRQTNKTAHQISSIILTIVCENAGQEAQKNRGKTATCPSCRGRNKPFGGQPGPDRFPVVPGPLVPVSAPNTPWEATDQSGPRIGIGEGIVGAAIGRLASSVRSPPAREPGTGTTPRGRPVPFLLGRRLSASRRQSDWIRQNARG